MDFTRIGGLLEKYRHLVQHGEERKKKIQESIIRITRIDIPLKDIAIRENIVRISGNSVFQNELFLYREHIIEDLHKKGITDIFSFE